MMVERREGDEGEARAVSGGGPLQQEGVLDEADDGEVESREDDGKGGDDEQGYDDDSGEEEEEEEEENQEERSSEIRLAIEELSLSLSLSPAKQLKHGDAVELAPVSPPPPTLPFLSLSHLVLRVLDKIGPTMAVLRLDVQRNIERLQEAYLLDPCKYSTLTAIVEKEVKDGTARKVDSCSRAVLWLTRSMDFTIALLQRLGAGSESDQQSLAQHVEAAYSLTLKQWHGWISAAAYKIAMKLLPETKVFTSFLVVGTDQDSAAMKGDIEKLALLLQPFLHDVHSMMAKFRLDRLKST